MRIPWPLRLILCALVMCSAAACTAPAGRSARPIDVLVVAPHSDDEAIGCTAVIRRALEQKRRVGIVVVTAGDAHVRAAAALAHKEIGQLSEADFQGLAALRQRHTLEAMPRLGVDRADILFLGNHDGGLAPMYAGHGVSPYMQPHTRRTQTYGEPIADYHTQVHGRPALYAKDALLDDLTEIIRTRRPSEIYTTDEADTHKDHSTTSRFVRDAAASARFSGRLLTYVVLGEPPSRPPAVRIRLTAEELRMKEQIITLYQRGVSPVHDGLAAEYARAEEVFWER
jgi:LmbE family N-acetylglucosaminyl deacetylase